MPLKQAIKGGQVPVHVYTDEIEPQAYAQLKCMAATIWFIQVELGITQVFMHRAHSGAAVKRIRDGQPPRSLDASLPEKFCLEAGARAPVFVGKSSAYRRLRKRRPVMFYQL